MVARECMREGKGACVYNCVLSFYFFSLSFSLSLFLVDLVYNFAMAA